MPEVVISCENISKQYRLGVLGSKTVSQDLNRWWARVRGKEDPFLKIGMENKLDTSDGDFVWALRDINFEVNRGDVLGIIGKNGAGKSTLLKLLSRVTTPTTGLIKLKGQIASLLEVGTGFHPELTGRENIFLNGAILGMTKSEIKSKLEEIIEFSGIGKYIDTPVKRYSSGMYVRLAFAVAAHLDPEVLVVDEVLAVGDAEFQKKALGKMQDVSRQDGRTVLFVSHNMTAIKSLCRTAILMKQGKIEDMGATSGIVDKYLKLNTADLKSQMIFSNPEVAKGNEDIKIKTIRVSPDKITIGDNININFEFWNTSSEVKFKIAFDLVNINEQIIFGSGTDVEAGKGKIGSATCHIPANLLNDDVYIIHVFFFTEGMRMLYMLKEAVSFEVHDMERNYAYYGKVNGVIRPKLNWD